MNELMSKQCIFYSSELVLVLYYFGLASTSKTKLLPGWLLIFLFQVYIIFGSNLLYDGIGTGQGYPYPYHGVWVGVSLVFCVFILRRTIGQILETEGLPRTPKFLSFTPTKASLELVRKMAAICEFLCSRQALRSSLKETPT